MATEPKAVRRMAGFTQVRIKAKRADANTLAAVPLTISGTTGQTGDLLQVTNVSGTVLTKITAAGNTIHTAAASLATPFGLGGSLLMGRAKYDFAVDGGAVTTITPATNCVIPINAIIYRVLIHPTSTTIGTTGNISFGLSAGGAGAAALLANTARASLATGTFFDGIPLQGASGANTSYIKMSAAGSVTMTIATNVLTAGVVEVTIFYVVAAN